MIVKRLYTIIKRKNEKSYNKRDAIKFNDSKHIYFGYINKLKDGNKLIIFYPYCNGNKQNQSMNALRDIIQNIARKRELFIIQ